MFNIEIIYLTAAFTFDRILGDPEFKYHPIRAIGFTAKILEKVLNKGRWKKFKGFLYASCLIVSWYFFFYSIESKLKENEIIYGIYHVLFLYFGISSYELSKRALLIEDFMKENMSLAKYQLSLIVGRDTAPLNEQGVRKALIETLSENLSDGFVAPLFYYLLGGLPLLYAYKVVNTLDSMVGYKNEKFAEFGFFSAKIDDILNFIPARITVLILFFSTFNKRVITYAFKYGRNHPSPNSGYPEASMAGILQCRLGGPNYYSGNLINKPFLGEVERVLYQEDIIKSVKIIKRASYLAIALSVIFLIGLIKKGG